MAVHWEYLFQFLRRDRGHWSMRDYVPVREQVFAPNSSIIIHQYPSCCGLGFGVGGLICAWRPPTLPVMFLFKAELETRGFKP